MNVQGEEQKKLDVVTNDVIKRALKFTGKVGVIASEEEDKPVFNKDAYRVPGGEGKYQDVLADIGSKYVTVFDPLDGSSNVRAREDSTKVLLRLAHSPHVGGVVVGLHTLRPLPNSKSQHAALGRLELLAESRTSSRHSSPPLLPGAGTVSSARLLSGPTRRKVHLGRSCGFR